MITDIKKTFQNIPTLYTERLTLRRIKKQDIYDIYDYSKNPETSKFLLWYPHTSIKMTKQYYKVINKGYKRGTFYDWGIIENKSGRMIGTCGFSRINTVDNKAEIGYVINPAFKMRGYATEAAKRIISFGFDELLLNRIEAKFIVENIKSLRVMEKCNMKFEGTHRAFINAKGRYLDIGVSAILRDEFYYQG